MTGTACELNDSEKGEKIMTNSRVRLLFAGSVAVVILALNIYVVSSGYATQFYERIDVSLHEPAHPLNLNQEI